MSSYLGSLGRMVPVVCAVGVAQSPDRPGSMDVTLGGRRFSRMAPRGHRAWSLTSSDLDSPSELAPVQFFAGGAWGDGPFWWLSPWAVAVNVLTPGGSVLRHADLVGGTVGGPVQAADGAWFPSSVVSAGSVHAVARSASRNFTAVPRGAVYTASLYVSAGQQVRVLERASAGGANVATRLSAVSSGAGLRRVSVTATAAQAANLLILDVVGAGVCAGAAISLTPGLVPWGVGDGCEEAVVRDGGVSVTSLAYGPYAGQSYEVMEVG